MNRNRMIKITSYKIDDVTIDNHIVLQYDIWLLKRTYLVSSNLHGPVMEFDSLEDAELFLENICKEYTNDS